MSGKMEQPSWVSQAMASRSVLSGTSYISQSVYDSLCSVLRDTESDSTLTEESVEESPSDKILSHCFKQFKLRNEYPYYSLKLKPNRFGPPRSRRRIFIAPPMDNMACGIHKPHPPVPSKAEKVQELEPPPVAQDSTPTEESDLLNMEAWIKERKQLRNLLEDSVNLEEWLTAKKPLTQQEESTLRKLKGERQEKEAKIQAELLALQSIASAPKIEPMRIKPLIRAPYPPSIITLQNLLHKQKLKLVDLFKKADRSRTMKFKRVDFLRIIQETKVPISKTDLEEIIVFLTLSKKGPIITAADLAECQGIWMDSVKESWKQPKQEPVERTSITSSISTKGDIFSYRRKSSISSQGGQSRLHHLQVPPINTEPDRRHLTYNQMEIVGKRYKETRRRLKRKTSPLDFADQCRLVRSGDPAVDGHCMPSTLEGEMGELVDQHRLACYYVYCQCVKICKKYGIPISERALKRGLLYAGDRLLRLGKDIRKLRQPGGYYNNSIYLGEPVSSSKVAERRFASHPRSLFSSLDSWMRSKTSSKKNKKVHLPLDKAPLGLKKKKPKPISKKPVKRQALAHRYKSFREFKKLMCKHSKKIYPPSDIWNESLFDENLPESPEEFVQKYMERELRRMFRFLNPLTNPNDFWPGHLLDKLYQPESRKNRSEVLFSRVSETCPVIPEIHIPRHKWPVNKKGYMILGDPESCKRIYYS